MRLFVQPLFLYSPSSTDTYNKVLGGINSVSRENILETVLGFIRLACAKGIHIEITPLIVPGLNDSVDELDACADFIVSLGGLIPWHLSAYHPDYRWNAPPTDPGFLLQAKKQAGKKLKFVYAGNIPGEENSTVCLHCKKILIRRDGYRVNTAALAPPQEGEVFFRCTYCGGETCIGR